MKDKRTHTFDLPSSLSPYIEAYLHDYRPVLLGKGKSSALWLTHHGAPFSGESVHTWIKRAALRIIGVELGPHAFRHIAATSMAMAEKHYEHASHLDANTRFQKTLRDVKRGCYPDDCSKSRGAN